MGYYFEDHAQRVQQWNRVRRDNVKPSGVIVIHTAENITDTVGPDTGAEAVARYMLTRTNYGSYHRLCDADSTIKLAPWSAETFHDTATNRHSVGISAAVSCSDWPTLMAMRVGQGSRAWQIVDRMAAEAADFITWIEAARGITVPVRRISRAEAHARQPGFIGHGESDPGRRSDPGPAFPWSYFLQRVQIELAGPTELLPPVPGGGLSHSEDTLLGGLLDMDATHILFENDGKLYIANILAGTYEHIKTPTDLAARRTVLQRTGAILKDWKDYKTNKGSRNNTADPAAFGKELK